MIEQTELVVSKWDYVLPKDFNASEASIREHTKLDVMRKRAATKKGLACKFTSYFTVGNVTILEYAAEHSYVIDLDEVIDRSELESMIKNTHSQFSERFDLRKLGTALQDTSLRAFEEDKYDLEEILPLLA